MARKGKIHFRISDGHAACGPITRGMTMRPDEVTCRLCVRTTAWGQAWGNMHFNPFDNEANQLYRVEVVHG